MRKKQQPKRLFTFAFNTVGYIGALAIIIAFTMLSFKQIEPGDTIYLMLNFFGAIGILVDAFYHDDYPSGFLHVVFAAVAFAAIIFNYVV